MARIAAIAEPQYAVICADFVVARLSSMNGPPFTLRY